MRMCCTSNCFEPCVAASRERGTTRTPLCRKWGMSNNHWLDALQLECLVCVWMCLQRLQEAATSTWPQCNCNPPITKKPQNTVLWTALEINFFWRGDLTKISQKFDHGASPLAIHNWQVQQAAKCSKCDLETQVETGKLQQTQWSYKAVCLPFLPLGRELLHTNE